MWRGAVQGHTCRHKLFKQRTGTGTGLLNPVTTLATSTMSPVAHWPLMTNTPWALVKPEPTFCGVPPAVS